MKFIQTETTSGLACGSAVTPSPLTPLPGGEGNKPSPLTPLPREEGKKEGVLFPLVVAAFIFATCVSAPAPGFAQQPAGPTAAASTTIPPQTPVTTQPDDRYRIGPTDVLAIRILNRPHLSSEAVSVDGNGMIRMPLIDGEIKAACRTEGELAKEISDRYLKFYRNPQVDVFIKEYHSRRVAIIGAVNKQGRFELQRRRYRLLDLLTSAEGLSDKAGQTVNIIRGERMALCDNQLSGPENVSDAILSFRLSDTMSGLEKANPYLQPDDIITIPEADQVYVIGNVYTPKTLPLKEPMTVSRAIAMAGGPLQDSKTTRIKVLRQEPGSTTKTELYVDLSAIAKKRADDLALRPNDIIEVPTSTGKSLLRSLLGSVAPSIAQLPIRVIP